MTNILVTGAAGFIGSALVSVLSSNGYNVLSFVRSSTAAELDDCLQKADFIFHLAGEVRPDSSEESFIESNTGLTALIVNRLMELNLSTPVVFSSTVHAIQPKNAYGQTKRQSEELLEHYARSTNAPVIIFRLPHMFGEGCKPNYNSVISTWIYNLVHDLDVVIYDRKVMMNYCYIGDFIQDCLALLSSKPTGCQFLAPSVVFPISLGDVFDLLHKIHIEAPDRGGISDAFSERLFSTYLSYQKD
ncbi:NAD-dependent epimerase/dehydratase family protein [Neptuniibacter pectenicola]|uniref:NAD-dependent epimerase/dehydratase family protein n=1 Tax=Neptuniibacter pectenicola TaxID=1806669 RepID=A0ABU9TMM8_9GAMM